MENLNIFTPESEKFLFDYHNNTSPTGFEMPGQKLWLEYTSPFFDEWHTDLYGTVYGVINPQETYKVVIEAHADEISWFIHHISKEGFISVIRNGGSDPIVAPSKRVDIHTKKGKVRGVFGWPAIHTRSVGERAKLTPSVENLFIDIGVKSKEEAEEMGVHVGCVVTFPDELEQMNQFYCGRALDNRMGGFCIAQVARLLHENQVKLPFALYVVNSVQEEVGLRGATMIAETLRPNVALVTDVCHDTGTPLMEGKRFGDVTSGKGPELTYAPAVHNRLLQLIIETAEQKSIPFQRAASYRSTGTDTDAFSLAAGGVASALISLPLRYMHTTVEMAHKSDIENVIRLIYETLLKIERNHNFKYF